MPCYPKRLPDTITAAPHADTVFTIEGKVSDKSGEPIIGASVRLKENSGIYAVTDADGGFRISNIPDSCGTMEITYVGFLPQAVRVSPEKTNYSIVLNSGYSELDEVVVCRPWHPKKDRSDRSGFFNKFWCVRRSSLTNVTNAMAGLAAGLTVTNSGGNTPGYESQSILVRGQGTLNNSAPLVVVDGMTGIALSDINPQDIENISVLKDAASAAIYGLTRRQRCDTCDYTPGP